MKRMYNYMINIVACGFFPYKIKLFLLRKLGMKIGNHVMIRRMAYTGGLNITVKDNTYIGPKLYYDGKADVYIGENCDIAPQVMLCTNTHIIGKGDERRAGADYYKPITIKDRCWIGARATILPGVTIEEGCIIAAGAVVNKSCLPNGLYAGVPARRIKDLV